MDKEKISIKVTDPQNDPTKSFITYLVSGNDQFGTFQIRRRFNDFYYLREGLLKKWPGLYIPPVPQKKINIIGKEQDQIEYRKKFFEYFLIQLTTYHHLFYCKVTQQFLRNKTIDMQKYLALIPLQTSEQLTNTYKTIFPQADPSQNSIQNRTACTNFKNFLKNSEKNIKNLCGEMEVIIKARNNFLQNLNACTQQMLPEFQRNVYIEYLPQKNQDLLLFVNDHKIQDNIRNLRDNTIKKPNPFSNFYDMLVYQARQLECFLEAINSKEGVQQSKKKLQQKRQSSQAELSKLLGGKFSFKSVFSKGSKDEQIKILQKQIPILNKQIEQLQVLCDLLNCIQGSVQICTFKKHKQQQYYEVIKCTSEGQLDYLASYGDFMKSVMVGLGKTCKL